MQLMSTVGTYTVCFCQLRGAWHGCPLKNRSFCSLILGPTRMHFKGPDLPGSEWMSPASSFSTLESHFFRDQHWHFRPSSSGALRIFARSNSLRAVEWTRSFVIFW